MEDVINCDPLGDGDITNEEDPLACKELDIKDEPFEFLDEPSCWASVGTDDNSDDEEFPGLEILSVDDIAKDDGGDSNHLELIEMIEVGGPDVSSPIDEVASTKELIVDNGSHNAERPKKELQSSGQLSIDKEKLNALVKQEASLLRTQQRREREMVKKKELQCQLEMHKVNIKRLQKELNEEKDKMQAVQTQLINLKRRVKRQELKIKKVREGSIMSLDSSHHIFEDECKTSRECSPLTVVETKDIPKDRKKEASASVKNFKSKRKAGVVKSTNDKVKQKKKINKPVVELQKREDDSKVKPKGSEDVFKLAGIKGKLKVSVAGLAMKRKASTKDDTQIKRVAKENTVKNAALMKDFKKWPVVSLMKCNEVQKLESEIGDDKPEEKTEFVEPQKVKHGSGKEIVKGSHSGDMSKPKQTNSKPNELTDELQSATLLWNVTSRIKLQPYNTTTPKKKTSEVYPNHYFQRVSLGETTTAALPKLIQKFMKREDVSKACSVPAGSETGKISSHFQMHYLSVLHKQFESEYGNVCNYKTFSEFVPESVTKPNPSYWRTCICFPCINPDLKYEKLKSVGLISEEELELADVLQDSEKEDVLRTQLCALRDSRDMLTYNVWERNSSGTVNSKLRSISEPIAIVVAKLQEELSLLKSHIQKTFCQFDSAKLARERALDSYDEVTFHLDSSPLSVYPDPGQENGVTEPSAVLTALSGYIWSRGGGQKVIAVSDSKDYTFAGVWAAIEKILMKMVEAGKKKINIISDSPTNKYRNKSTFYYLSDFAQTHGVCLRWVFLELCHSIGHAGIIKSELENVIRHQISQNPQVSVKCATELVNLIKPHSAAVIHTYTEEDVQRYKCLQPKLRVIQGTQKIVEVIAFPGEFWARDAVGTDNFRRLSF